MIVVYIAGRGTLSFPLASSPSVFPLVGKNMRWVEEEASLPRHTHTFRI